MITENKILSNIITCRQNKGYSQENMATRVGMKQAGYSLIESGQRKMSITLLLQIAIALDMDVLDLLAYPEKRENNTGGIRATLSIELQKDKKDQILKLVFGDNNLEILNK